MEIRFNIITLLILLTSCSETRKRNFDLTINSSEIESIESKITISNEDEFQQAKSIYKWQTYVDSSKKTESSKKVIVNLANGKSLIFEDDFGDSTEIEPIDVVDYEFISSIPKLNRCIVGVGFVCGGESYIIDIKNNKIDTCGWNPIVLPMISKKVFATATHDDNAGSEVKLWGVSSKNRALKSISIDEKYGALEDIAWLNESTLIFTQKSFVNELMTYHKISLKYKVKK